jgi:putative iron-regulated protein
MAAAMGCSDSGTGPDLSHYDASAILQNDAHNVILQTYIDLNTEAGKLVTAVQTLQKNTTQANLETARKQWRKTRVPWESSESFLFGPVETEQIDPHIDSWPLNKTDLNNVLSGNAELTEKFIRNQTNNLKGFHTIEYLLWGGYNEHKQAADLTKRELSYMVAAAKALKDETQSLVTSWSP